MSGLSRHHGPGRSRISLIGILLFIGGVVTSSSAIAQSSIDTTRASNSHGAGKRFYLMIGGSRTWSVASSWSDQLMNALTSAGLNDYDPGGYSIFGYTEPAARPSTDPGSNAAGQIIVGFGLNNRLEIRARFAYRGELGTTIGHAFDSYATESYSYDIYIRPSVRRFSLSVIRALNKRFWIGVGPALTVVKFQYDSFVSVFPYNFVHDSNEEKKTVPGAVFEMGLRFPPRSRFFAELTAAYFVAPETTVGPIELAQPDGTIGRRIPETGLNLNWGEVGFCLGITIQGL